MVALPKRPVLAAASFLATASFLAARTGTAENQIYPNQLFYCPRSNNTVIPTEA
jgi:hypothetical protein